MLPRPTDLKLSPTVAYPFCPTQRLSYILNFYTCTHPQIDPTIKSRWDGFLEPHSKYCWRKCKVSEFLRYHNFNQTSHTARIKKLFFLDSNKLKSLRNENAIDKIWTLNCYFFSTLLYLDYFFLIAILFFSLV